MCRCASTSSGGDGGRAGGRARGVRVLAVCPGATDTAFFDVVGAAEAGVGKRMPADTVVRASLQALDRGLSHVVPGAANRMLGCLPRMLPRQAILQIVANILRPRRPAPN